MASALHASKAAFRSYQRSQGRTTCRITSWTPARGLRASVMPSTRRSQLFAPTHRDPSEDLLNKAGYTQQISAGLFAVLPLGQRVVQNISKVIEHELDTAGCQKLDLPLLVPEQLMKKSGRLDTLGPDMFTFPDRSGRPVCLAPTHEECISTVVGKVVRSHRSLPLRLYQIGHKFRDELRPRHRLLRTRDFVMMDTYSFDVDETASAETYEQMCTVFENIFRRLELPVHKVKASAGVMGGDQTHEYHYFSESGEDTIFKCRNCGSAGNKELFPDQQNVECFECGGTQLEKHSGVEMGQVFNLGLTYSEPFSVRVTSAGEKAAKPVSMGCYGIGVSRVLEVMAEHHADDKGLAWPTHIAPYRAIIMAPDIQMQAEAEALQDKLARIPELRHQVVFDDRNQSLHLKSVDSDLIGFPFRILVGREYTKQQRYEVETRSGQRMLANEHELLTLLTESTKPAP